MNPNMIKIENIKDLQKIEYNILCKVVEFLDNNNITYFLAGGSLLGAIRHGGFIPWDDDIDILIPRDDYERFRKIMKDKSFYLTESVKIMVPGMDMYPYPFIKAVDLNTFVNDKMLNDVFPNFLWVDIFPLDHFPDNDIKHRYYVFKNQFLKKILMSETRKNGLNKGQFIMKNINKMCGGYKNIVKLMDEVAINMDKKHKKSKHYGNGTWLEGMKDYYKEEYIFPLTQHLFEENKFNIPENYHDFLTYFYGDYMTPPPLDSRDRHFIEAYLCSSKNETIK